MRGLGYFSGVVLAALLTAQAQVITIGGANWDEGFSIIQTADGGYAIAGYTTSFGQGAADVYVVKLDGTGNVQWTKTIGGANNDYGYSIIQAADGGYVIAGYTESFGQGLSDVYVVKLDGTGNVQWTKTIGGTGDDGGYSIIQTSDGGYAIAGYTTSFGQGGADVYVVKLDGAGNVQWTKTIGGTGADWGYSIIQAVDGSYAIAGKTYSFGQGLWDVYVVKLDGTGNVQWTKTLGGANDDVSISIIQTSDGGYAVTGWTGSFGQGNGDVYVVKLDGAGNLQWTKIIGGAKYDEGYSIIQTADGGYAIAGYTTSFGQVGDVYVVKLDGAGNLQWTKTIGGVFGDEGYSIIQTSDGGYTITGRTWSFGQGINDVFVVKLDGTGNVNMGNCGSVISDSGMVSSGGDTLFGGTIASATPNVVSDSGVVSSGGSVYVCVPLSSQTAAQKEREGCQVLYNNTNLKVRCPIPATRIRLFDINGRKQLDVVLDKRTAEINVANLVEGVYCIEVLLKDKSRYRTKVVKW